jgi:ribose transport system ATP-binding protein/rhamnose transport system ATP-binding protein
MVTPLLAARSISKSFGPNDVLKGIEFGVNPGAVVALCGENGAGKSTLIKTMSGVYQPTGGHVEFEGQAVNWLTPRESIDAGVAVVHQEFSTISALTVAENIFLEAEPRTRLGLIDRRELNSMARSLLDDLGIHVDPLAVLQSLSVAEQQMVEIAKALRSDAKVLILDEPTAVLSTKETRYLFGVINSLRQRGIGLVYVSHRLDEIFEICTDITVIKDGVVTSRGPIEEYDHDKIVSSMVGRSLGDLFPPKADPTKIGPVRLEARGIQVADHQPVDIAVRGGEIVGLAGLVGSGRTELVRTIFGADESTGTVLIDGTEFSARTPARSISHGMPMLTESRKHDGLFTESSVAWNFAASSLGKDASEYAIPHRHEEQRSHSVVDRFKVVVNDVGLPISSLSGGNQQKILIGRILENDPKVLILDEPTRGVDVGAKAQIYRTLRMLADSGMAILVISSELIEIVGLVDRAFVMRDGQLAAELSGEEITEDGIIAVAAAGEPKELDDV